MKTVLRWRFDPMTMAWALMLLVLLVLLATVGARTGWLRGFFGDVLAVMWLHAVFRSVLAVRPARLAFAAFGIGCALELCQYVAALWHWQWSNRALRILFGSTPDWNDVLAYGLGLVVVLLLEAWRVRSNGTGEPA